MEIRAARPSDMPEILRVYARARKYMEDTGNPDQWGKTHPPRQLLEKDIETGLLYVGVGDGGGIRLCFALVPGADPTYARIDGAWLNDAPYAAIHRVASDGAEKGAFAKCLAFCRSRYENLRIDTHADNATMQHVVEKNGFVRCGIIYLENGDPRIAYQLSCR
jgi:hypothetical protein